MTLNSLFSLEQAQNYIDRIDELIAEELTPFDVSEAHVQALTENIRTKLIREHVIATEERD